jgi:hypothetical protein
MHPGLLEKQVEAVQEVGDDEQALTSRGGRRSEPEKRRGDFRIACRDSSRLLPAPMGKCGFW